MDINNDNAPATEAASPPERIWLWPTSKEGCADRWHLIGHPAEGDIEYARVRLAQEQARLAAEEIARRWLAHDLPMKAQIQSLSLLQLEILALDVIERRLNCNERAAAPPPEAREIARKVGVAISRWLAPNTSLEGFHDTVAAIILSAGVVAEGDVTHWMLALRASATACGIERGIPAEQNPPTTRLEDYVTCPNCQLVALGYKFGRADERAAAPQGDFRAGVAACVARLKTKAKEFKKLWEVDLSGDHNDKFAHAEVLIAMARELESLTDSAASPAAQPVELHYPFAAKHPNCAKCDKEYEPPPAAQQEVNEGELLPQLVDALTERSITAHIRCGHEQDWAGCEYAVCSEIRELLTRARISEGELK